MESLRKRERELQDELSTVKKCLSYFTHVQERSIRLEKIAFIKRGINMPFAIFPHEFLESTFIVWLEGNVHVRINPYEMSFEVQNKRLLANNNCFRITGEAIERDLFFKMTALYEKHEEVLKQVWEKVKSTVKLDRKLQEFSIHYWMAKQNYLRVMWYYKRFLPKDVRCMLWDYVKGEYVMDIRSRKIHGRGSD